jgi:hypothetical protein
MLSLWVRLCFFLLWWILVFLNQRKRWSASRNIRCSSMNGLLWRTTNGCAYHTECSLMNLPCTDKFVRCACTPDSITILLKATLRDSWHWNSIRCDVGNIGSENATHRRCTIRWVSTGQNYSCIVLLRHVMLLLVGALNAWAWSSFSGPAKRVPLDYNDIRIFFVALLQEL